MTSLALDSWHQESRVKSQCRGGEGSHGVVQCTCHGVQESRVKSQKYTLPLTLFLVIHEICGDEMIF